MRRRSRGSRSRLDPMEAARKDAWRYLRVRERTRAEMRSYLRRRGHGESIVRDLTEELVAAGLLDDRRFAVIYLMDRMRLKPVGSRRARAELRAKGVSEEIIAEALRSLSLRGTIRSLPERRFRAGGTGGLSRADCGLPPPFSGAVGLTGRPSGVYFRI